MDAQNYKNVMIDELEIEDGCKSESLEYKYKILNTECIVWFGLFTVHWMYCLVWFIYAQKKCFQEKKQIFVTFYF